PILLLIVRVLSGKFRMHSFELLLLDGAGNPLVIRMTCNRQGIAGLIWKGMRPLVRRNEGPASHECLVSQRLQHGEHSALVTFAIVLPHIGMEIAPLSQPPYDNTSGDNRNNARSDGEDSCDECYDRRGKIQGRNAQCHDRFAPSSAYGG